MIKSLILGFIAVQMILGKTTHQDNLDDDFNEDEMMTHQFDDAMDEVKEKIKKHPGKHKFSISWKGDGNFKSLKGIDLNSLMKKKKKKSVKFNLFKDVKVSDDKNHKEKKVNKKKGGKVILKIKGKENSKKVKKDKKKTKKVKKDKKKTKKVKKDKKKTKKTKKKTKKAKKEKKLKKKSKKIKNKIKKLQQKILQKKKEILKKKLNKKKKAMLKLQKLKMKLKKKEKKIKKLKILKQIIKKKKMLKKLKEKNKKQKSSDQEITKKDLKSLQDQESHHSIKIKKKHLKKYHEDSKHFHKMTSGIHKKMIEIEQQNTVNNLQMKKYNMLRSKLSKASAIYRKKYPECLPIPISILNDKETIQNNPQVDYCKYAYFLGYNTVVSWIEIIDVLKMTKEEAWAKIKSTTVNAYDVNFQQQNEQKRNIKFEVSGKCFAKGMRNSFLRNYEKKIKGEKITPILNPKKDLKERVEVMQDLVEEVQKVISK